MSQIEINKTVTRVKGEPSQIGCQGEIVELDPVKQSGRARVKWVGGVRTWVKFNVFKVNP